jgi:glycosyltransferase involved in cell wall biosynthesis
MMTDYPMVSILIPSYNHEKYISLTIESILRQTYPNLEVVVVDDCSTDQSMAVLQEYSDITTIRLFKNEENIGAKECLNKAFMHSEGDLILLMASDDLLIANCLDDFVRPFRENSSLKVLYANGLVLKDGRENKKLHGPKVKALLEATPKKIRRHLYTNVSRLFLQCALIRRDLYTKLDYFDDTILADDWLINVRIFENISHPHEMGYLDKNVTYYRSHGANIHNDKALQNSLKINFIEKVTPMELKAEGYSNIYYSIAKAALQEGDLNCAIENFKTSFKAKSKLYRLGFIFRYFVKACLQR